MYQVIIYGAGNTGKSAYYFLKSQQQYECLFFVDSDSNKWGTEIDGHLVKSPEILKQYGRSIVIIASIYWKEIFDNIMRYDFLDIIVYSPVLKKNVVISDSVKHGLNKRTIDLGAFLQNEKEIFCKQLTFTPGGSMVLDYAFLRALVKKYDCKNYLEIGSFIGESINVLTDCCEKLYSITAATGEKDPVFGWYKKRNLPYYGGRLINSKKIMQFFADSTKFDFSQIKDEIHLFFIDGDHKYEGVYADTKNVFEIKKANSIVVWHDFRGDDFQYRGEVINAVKDVLGDKFNNVYVTNGNLCGIYLPDQYIHDFKFRELKFEENAKLDTYNILIRPC